MSDAELVDRFFLSISSIIIFVKVFVRVSCRIALLLLIWQYFANTIVIM